MRKSFTAVLEQGNTFNEDFSTEPYEVGWAAEARWFIRVLELTGSTPDIELFPEISPDGLFWCKDETPHLYISQEGLFSFSQRDFGQWLRLSARVSGKNTRLKVIIYLALKE